MYFDLTRALEILERTPATLNALLRGLSDEWIRPNEGSGSWSVFDNVGHLITGERSDWMARLRVVLAQGSDRRFQAFDRTAMLARDRDRTLDALLDEFASLRAANVAELRGLDLSHERLQLTGEHPTFGSVTAEQLLATWVVHDLGHLAQMSRVMAKQYAQAVGPWAAFLPILADRAEAR